MSAGAMTDLQLAAYLAAEAGRVLMEVRAAGAHCGKALGQAGDTAANAWLIAALREWRPADGVLSEEQRDTAARLARRRVWIIDPLDGTREYAEGREDWAVHVALAVDGMAEVGAVSLPACGELHTSGGGAVPRPEPPIRPRMVVSRTRPPAEALAVAEALGAELIAMGSAGAKAMAVVRGDADIYLHTGGQHQWDNCAPVAVACAHGLHCSRIDGSALVYNGVDTLLPDLLICDPAHAATVLSLLAQHAV